MGEAVKNAVHKKSTCLLKKEILIDDKKLRIIYTWPTE